MTDTTYTIAKTVQTSTDAIDLITKVDSFYNSAWEKLVIIVSISFGIVGIIVPFIIQWYQKKTLKISEELLKSDIETKALKIKSDLLLEIDNTLEVKMKQFDLKLEKHNASSNAKSFHLQGVSMIKEGKFSNALSDFVKASEDFLFSENYQNLQRSLKNISHLCIPELSKEEISDLKILDDTDLEKLLSDLETRDDNDMFIDVVREIRFKLVKMPENKKNTQPKS
jgi:hypothetical protein